MLPSRGGARDDAPSRGGARDDADDADDARDDARDDALVYQVWSAPTRDRHALSSWCGITHSGAELVTSVAAQDLASAKGGAAGGRSLVELPLPADSPLLRSPSGERMVTIVALIGHNSSQPRRLVYQALEWTGSAAAAGDGGGGGSAGAAIAAVVVVALALLVCVAAAVFRHRLPPPLKSALGHLVDALRRASRRDVAVTAQQRLSQRPDAMNIPLTSPCTLSSVCAESATSSTAAVTSPEVEASDDRNGGDQEPCTAIATPTSRSRYAERMARARASSAASTPPPPQPDVAGAGAGAEAPDEQAGVA